MNRAFSVYLDLVRFLAACLVYVYHSNQRLLTHEVLPLSSYGHSAVIVFFVLSGYVIAFVTDTKERDWRTYTASRLSRVYSVALPAIVLTLTLDAAGRALLPAVYQNYPFDQHVLRAAISALMLNEVWFVSVTSFSNVPYWSVTYEIWYYVAFGMLTFLPKRMAVLCLVALAILLGPKIALLAPIWALGVFLYRSQWLNNISLGVAWPLLALSVLGIVIFHQGNVQDLVTAQLRSVMGKSLYDSFTFSKFAPTDYVLTVFVAANFVAMKRVAEASEQAWLLVEKPIRLLAAYTFTLYLLHQPLFLFWTAVLRWDPKHMSYWWAVTALTACSVAVVGHFTESRRHTLRRWLMKLLARRLFHSDVNVPAIHGK